MTAAYPQAAEAGHRFRLRELASLLDARLENADPELEARSYAVDSRAVREGSVFLALKGARTDGHAFLADLRARGAVAAVVHEDARLPDGLGALRVALPEAALAALGTHFRSAWPLRVVGITGSAGKTTTKEFAATLLARRWRVFRSEGNLNSTIGLPLTLTRRGPEAEVAVLELGMSTPGELRKVAAIARPDVAVVTNVGLAHVGNFQSADDIAREKAQILEGVPKGGSMVANADDARVMAMARSFPGPVVSFGVQASADVRALDLAPAGLAGTRFTLQVEGRSRPCHLPVIGGHHVHNLLAALASARALGLDALALADELEALSAGPHRGGLRELAGNVVVLDDCYNSNPAALASALDALASLKGRRRVAVIGDMLELGAYSEVSHREAGRQAALRADLVIGVGPESAALVEEAHATGCRDTHHVPDAATAAPLVAELVRDGDAVLVKASRSVGLESVLEALQKARS